MPPVATKVAEHGSPAVAFGTLLVRMLSGSVGYASVSGSNALASLAYPVSLVCTSPLEHILVQLQMLATFCERILPL